MTTDIWINYKNKHIAEATLTLFLTDLYAKNTNLFDINLFPDEIIKCISDIQNGKLKASYNEIIDAVISQWLLDRTDIKYSDEQLVKWYGIKDPGIGRMDIYKCPKAVLDYLDNRDGYWISPKNDVIVNFTL